jgi:urea transport system substrate-binding protein
MAARAPPAGVEAGVGAFVREAGAAEPPVPPAMLLDRGLCGAFPPLDLRGLPRFRSRRDRSKLRIVNFIALSGSAGIWGPASINASMLAVSEINRRGGILGRELELVVRDAGCELDELARQALDIVENDEGDIIIGSHMSVVRVALRKVIAGRLPYIYTPVYEGGERTPGVMAIGETPRGQSLPVIQWLAQTRHASRWYLIGSDYVWPWLSHRAIKRYIAASGGRVVGEEFVPLGMHDHDDQVARIKAARPDVVLISLIGTNSITFNRAFAEAGLGRKMLRFCGAMDETVLLGIGADNTENLFCSSGYFSELASRDGDRFRASYQAKFGRHAPSVGSVAQSNYEGFKFLETVAARAGSVALDPMLAAARNVSYRGARGEIVIRNGDASMPIYLAEAAGLDFAPRKRF